MSESPAPLGTPKLLSIIIPSYNQGRFLRQCLDSILSQDYRPVEIIVVDGASRDDTVDVLKSYAHVPQLRWISEPDDGPASAVNKGLALAQGEFAAIQSADDYYLPGAFSIAMKTLAADRGLGLVYGEVLRVNEHGRAGRVSRRPAHDNALCVALCICIPQCSAFFRTALALELGGWRKDYYCCDWDLWLRMMFRTGVRKVDEALSAWRIYPGQRTDQRRKVFDGFHRMLDESPELRAAGGEMRRAVRAAKQLIAVSFGPQRGKLARLWHVIAAAAWFPRMLWSIGPADFTSQMRAILRAA